MVWFDFGKWSHRGGSWFTWDRIYKDGYKWTPLCIIHFRYIDGKHRNEDGHNTKTLACCRATFELILKHHLAEVRQCPVCSRRM